MVTESERLYLRELCPDDFQSLCRILQDDYTKTGLELFVIETIKESDETEELVTLKAELEKQLEDKGITVYR